MHLLHVIHLCLPLATSPLTSFLSPVCNATTGQHFRQLETHPTSTTTTQYKNSNVEPACYLSVWDMISVGTIMSMGLLKR